MGQFNNRMSHYTGLMSDLLDEVLHFPTGQCPDDMEELVNALAVCQHKFEWLSTHNLLTVSTQVFAENKTDAINEVIKMMSYRKIEDCFEVRGELEEE